MREPFSPDWDASERVFFQELGKTLARWANIEIALSELFEVLSGTSREMAKHLFYSSRSFTGRIDLLRAALGVSARREELDGWARAAINKSRQYSSFRNAIAHGTPLGIGYPDSEHAGRIVLVRGEDTYVDGQTEVISRAMLITARENFELLERLIGPPSRFYIPRAQGWTAQSAYEELIRSLPHDPQHEVGDPAITSRALTLEESEGARR